MENLILKTEKFNKICRTCLSVSENLSPLFENNEDKSPIVLLESLNILKVIQVVQTGP